MASKVQVVDKNAGKKIDWAQSKTKITFGDDDLTINCATRQREQDIDVDICYDSEQNLVIGAKGAAAYVAQIHIPGYEYDKTEITETVTDADGSEKEETRTVETRKELDMSNVVLTLWGIN